MVNFALLLEGQKVTRTIPCRFKGGGDMKWIVSVMGMQGYDFATHSLQAKEHYDKCLIQYTKKTTKMAFHLSHVAHHKSDFSKTKCVEVSPGIVKTVTGLWCPGCKKCFTSQEQLDEEEEVQAADMAAYRKSHFGHGWHTPPIFPFIEIEDYYLCILHLLLRVTGAMWKHCVGKRIGESKAKAEELTKFLHEKLAVYVPPLKTNSKAEILDIAKAPSMTGGESARVCEYFEDCVDKVVQYDVDKQKAMKAMKYFIRYYNLLNSRVHDTSTGNFISRAELEPKLQQKSIDLRVLGQKFCCSFIQAVDAESVTPYINTMSHEIPDMSKHVELIDVSGHALELTNQGRKKVTTTKGGGRGEGSLMVKQLATADVCVDHVRTKKYCTREASYQRNRSIGGHNGKTIESRLLADLPEEEEYFT